ncbi:class I SAM-dependent methyltransferase [Paenibacillus durus]|uniref:Methyltransferase n=1 Tax=Paenibacillus durus ATCC 35681 TaxID=1333534 RepID=A0A0F7FCN3_PAEDU|nr:class I SAM-dependent methyltransferase [Paenibacillus durus]AKG36165.1 methyltransferase [Paenibacillus durus ATCC 35681]
MSTEIIKKPEDVLTMLDSLMREPAPFWNHFYSDRTKRIPFFVEYPDENLVSYIESGMLNKGRMLELGCGPGRNAIYATLNGYAVDAIDISEEAITWAMERAKERNISVNFECKSVFNLQYMEEFDFVYDSGCLHHLWPHRRVGYIQMISNALKSKGYFGLTCFAPGFTEIGGAYELTDWEIYRERSMKGGQAYSKEKLIDILGDYFDLIELRAMNECNDLDMKFGVPFLWASLWRKK